MNEEQWRKKRARYLQRVALREARKAMQRDGRTPTQQELLELRVQSWQPWVRFVIMFVGSTALAGGVMLIKDDQILPGIVVSIAGLGIFGVGWFGHKETLGKSLDSVGGDFTVGIIQFILESLG